MAGPLMAVHMDESVAEVELFPGGYFAVNEETIKALREQTDQPCRVFTGYMGWEGRRLDDEVQQGLWRIVPATAEAVFSEGDGLWERLLRRLFHGNFTTCSIPSTLRQTRRSTESFNGPGWPLLAVLATFKRTPPHGTGFRISWR